MNRTYVEMMLALAAGAALGVFYFGGLWWTLRRLPTTRRPAVLMLGSFLGRTMLAVAGFYFIMGGHWPRLVAGMIAFFAVRMTMVRSLRPKTSMEG